MCISIGTGVPWLLAIYSEDRARQLPENSILGVAGTALGALAFTWLSPTFAIVALTIAGPPIALATIVGGQALKRSLLSRLWRPPA